jgi:tetratricopeptide (TPR) repeat protein
LFLVSLVHELIERGVLVQADAGWEFKEEAAVIANSVPGSIRYLVARQSERLSAEARRTLEAASVAGVEFSAAAVAAALATDTATVERQCEQLAERQQFLRRLGVEEWPDGTLAARYGFLHALYQQLWHERVTPTQLQHDHLQIGQRKERAYGERVREIAAELALHFEQARDYSRAVYYLHQASKTALRRLANQEAIHLITKGLSLLQLLPKTLERNQQELSLQFTLGAPLMVIKGYTAPELETVLTRIQELSQQVQDTRQLFQIVYILAIFYVGRAAFHTARELVVQLFTLAQRTHDALTHLRSRFAMSSTLLFRGEFVEARAHAEQGFRLYERCRGDRSMWEVHHNGLGCLNCLAWSLWMLGYPDQALSRTQEALTTAQTQALPSTLAETVSYAAWLAHIHRDWQTAEDHAAALLTLCTTHGFSLLQTEAAIIQGWAWAEQGREEGFAQIRRGLADYCAKRAEIMLPRSLALLATVYEKRGRAEEGLKLVVEALVRVDKTEGRLGEAELYRLKGELTLQSKVESEKGKEESQKSNGKSQRAKIPSPRRLTPGAQTEAAAEAEGCFLKAIEIAKTQQAKMWELRATVSLARLWQRQGKREKAWQILADIYDWFTEGFDTVDLKEARALLEELSEQDHGRLTL